MWKPTAPKYGLEFGIRKSVTTMNARMFTSLMIFTASKRKIRPNSRN